MMLSLLSCSPVCICSRYACFHGLTDNLVHHEILERLCFPPGRPLARIRSYSVEGCLRLLARDLFVSQWAPVSQCAFDCHSPIVNRPLHG